MNEPANDMPVKVERKRWNWYGSAPWILTALSVTVLFLLTWYLINNMNWFRLTAYSSPGIDDELHVYLLHMHSSLMKRSIGLFSGFALIFTGLAVSFYTLKTLTEVGLSSSALSDISLKTASPGLVAMVVGAAIVAFSIGSKDTFPALNGTQAEHVTAGHGVIVKPELPFGEDDK